MLPAECLALKEEVMPSVARARDFTSVSLSVPACEMGSITAGGLRDGKCPLVSAFKAFGLSSSRSGDSVKFRQCSQHLSMSRRLCEAGVTTEERTEAQSNGRRGWSELQIAGFRSLGPPTSPATQISKEEGSPCPSLAWRF